MNVIFIMSDQQRCDSIGPDRHPCADYPVMERLRSQSVSFDSFYASAIPCVPSRQTMLTGRQEWMSRGCGNVKFNMGEDTTWMSILRENENPTVPLDIDTAGQLNWLEYERDFTSTPLHEVLDQIEKWYNVQIHLTDNSYASNLITVHIERKPVENILDMIALIMNMNYRQEGSRVVFSPKNSG